MNPIGHAHPHSARPIKMHIKNKIAKMAIVIMNGQNNVRVRSSEPAVHNGTPSPNQGISQNFGNRRIGNTGEIHNEPITVKFNNNNSTIWENNLTYLIRRFGLSICTRFEELKSVVDTSLLLFMTFPWLFIVLEGFASAILFEFGTNAYPPVSPIRS
jgi:hypothetical protein